MMNKCSENTVQEQKKFFFQKSPISYDFYFEIKKKFFSKKSKYFNVFKFQNKKIFLKKIQIF